MSNLKIFTDNIEKEAMVQIHLLTNQSAFQACKIRIMPDVHAGSGCVIGFTADLGSKVIPNIVGVDIGCGMLTVPLGRQAIDVIDFDKKVHQFIPCGMNVHAQKILDFPSLKQLKCLDNISDFTRIECSLGTLGGGNHFIEIDQDMEGNHYLIIHSGSRNLGKQVADYYQKLAIQRLHKEHPEKRLHELINSLKAQHRSNEIQTVIRAFEPSNICLIPKDLCYLENDDRMDYLHDMKICQAYAATNRELMAKLLIGQIPKAAFHTVHNYIDFETHIVRKGAIRANHGEMVLIPLNMRDGCILATGKGNDDWNYSAPHGAGRIMSRGRAKATLNLDEYKAAMTGIYTTSVNMDTLDEAPFAYKASDEIIRNIQDTVNIIKIIKPIYNFKASE